MAQLCPRTSMEDLVDDLVTVALARAPGLPRERCRELVALILTSRLRQTTACGRDPACGRAAPDGDRPAGWCDPDPVALPQMFAAAAMDLIEGDPPRPLARARLQRSLADGFRAVLAPHVVENPRCGASPVCGAEPTWPIAVRR